MTESCRFWFAVVGSTKAGFGVCVSNSRKNQSGGGCMTCLMQVIVHHGAVLALMLAFIQRLVGAIDAVIDIEAMVIQA